jgi:hypothetical protein
LKTEVNTDSRTDTSGMYEEGRATSERGSLVDLDPSLSFRRFLPGLAAHINNHISLVPANGAGACFFLLLFSGTGSHLNIDPFTSYYHFSFIAALSALANFPLFSHFATS